MKNNYQMATVYQYLEILQNQNKEELKTEEQKIRTSIEKFINSKNRNQRNAQILEMLLD